SRRRMQELSAEIAMRSKAEKSAQENLKMFQTLFIEGLSGNFIAHTSGNVILCNEAFRSMSGMAVNARQEFNLAKALGASRWASLLQDLQGSGCLDFPELQLERPDHGAWIVMARFRISPSNQGKDHEIHG